MSHGRLLFTVMGIWPEDIAMAAPTLGRILRSEPDAVKRMLFMVAMHMMHNGPLLTPWGRGRSAACSPGRFVIVRAG